MTTRADLRSYARIRADQTNSTFPTDAEYNTLLDFAGRSVWYDLIRANWAAPVYTVDFAATGAPSYNPIPGANASEVLVHGVYRVDSDQPVPLTRLNEGDRAALSRTATAEYYTAAIDMADDGLVLALFPNPSSGTYRVHYILSFTTFTNDAAAWPGPYGSDELVGLRAAAMAMRKEGNDQGAAQVDREYATVLERVQAMASWLDLRHGATIRDVGDPLRAARDPFDFDV